MSGRKTRIPVVRAAIAALLLLAACASERDTSELPPADPKPVSDPSGTLTAWLDLRYAKSPAPAALQSLDLITPSAAHAGLPVVVFLHGGTWSTGDKRGGLEQKATRLVGESGFLLASINYRLAPEWKHPAQIEDVASALAWLHENAPRFGGRADRFVLLGHSAGAHLAALVATDERWLGAHGLPLSLIAGVAALDGAGYDLTERVQGEPMSERILASVFGADRAVWREASPVFHVAPGKGIARFLLFQAGDKAISLQATATFSAALSGAGLPFEVVHAPEKNHRSIQREFGDPGDRITNRFLDFAQEVTR